MKISLVVFVASLATAFTQTPEQKSEKVIIDEINAQICQHARDIAWQEYDFSYGPAPRENKEIIAALTRFNNGDCYQSPFVPEIDKQLLEKQARKIAK